MKVENTCVLCKNEAETAEHLIIQCSFARRIWGRLLSWIGKLNDIPMTWEHFVQWCIKHGKGKRSEATKFQTVLAEGSYGLWLERNRRIFEHKCKTEEQLVKEITYIAIVRTCSRLKDVRQSAASR